MNSIFKILVAGMFATGLAFTTMLVYYAGCYILIEHFKYRYGQENYWVFSHCFIVLIISWIISFACALLELKD